MHVAHHLHDDEQPNGDVHRVLLGAAVEVAAVALADALGDAAIGLAAAGGMLAQPGGEGHRLGHLHRGFGQHPGVLGLDVVHGAAGGEQLHVALAAVEDHLLVEDGHAVDGHRAGGRPPEQIQADIEEEGHVHGVKALVEGDGLQVDVHGDDVHLPHPDVGGAIHQGLPRGGEQNPYILDTVLVRAGIVHPLGIDADSFFKVFLAAVIGGAFVFSHSISSL